MKEYYGAEDEAPFIDPTLIQHAFGNNKYLPLVYKTNLAEMAYYISRISADQIGESSQILKLIHHAFPNCAGLDLDFTNQHLFLLLTIQYYLAALLDITAESPRKLSDQTLRFSELLRNVEFSNADDVSLHEQVVDILQSTRIRSEIIKSLSEKFPWNAFLREFSTWLAASSLIVAGDALVYVSSIYFVMFVIYES